MIYLLMAVAFAQEPQAFDPLPADVEVAGTMYRGILVDEATFAELGRLRVLKTQHEEKIEAYQSFEEWSQQHLATSLTAVETECASGRTLLVDHYEGALKEAKRKDFFQRHGLGVGIAIGVLSTTALTIGIVNAYDATLPSSLTGAP
mgnify:CR=1 FL=1